MSPDAAAALAQIVPVALLAIVLEGLQVNPRLTGWNRAGTALVATVVVLWIVAAEVLLVWAVIDDDHLSKGQTNFVAQALALAVGVIVLPWVLTAWGLDPIERRSRREDRARQTAHDLAMEQSEALRLQLEAALEVLAATRPVKPVVDDDGRQTAE